MIAELAQADHIGFAVGDGKHDKDNDDTHIRVGGMATVNAAVLAQNGNVLPLLSSRVTLSTDDDHIMLDDDGTITGVTVTKTDAPAVIKAESMDAGFSGEFMVKVSNPVVKIALSEDDLFLAADESKPVTATAQDKDDDETVPIPANHWKWTSDDPSVAKVVKMKDGDDVTHNVGVITGVSTGVATITVETEGGVMAEIEVTVTGQSVTRRLNASSSSNGNHFVWTHGGMGYSGDGTTEFNVNLYDIISNDRIETWTLTVVGLEDADLTSPDPGDAMTAPTVGVGVTAGTTTTVTVTAPQVDANVPADKTYSTIVILRSTGAKEVRLRFTVEVKPAPA